MVVMFDLTAVFDMNAPLFYRSKQQHSINQFICLRSQRQISMVYRPRSRGVTHLLPIPTYESDIYPNGLCPTHIR